MALLDTNTHLSAIIGDFGSGLDHPECITWGCDGYAYAGGEAGQIYRIDLAARTFEEFANVGGFVGGICQDAQRRLYVCVGDEGWFAEREHCRGLMTRTGEVGLAP